MINTPISQHLLQSHIMTNLKFSMMTMTQAPGGSISLLQPPLDTGGQY